MKKNILAKTFTPLYDETEDRLRVVINYQDIHSRVDFMITRNFILNLIPTAEEFILKQYGDISSSPQLMVVPKKEEMQSNKNNTLSPTDHVNLELLRTSEELLTEVNFSFNLSTKQTIVTFNSKNIVSKSALDASSLVQIFQVIKSAIPYIKWGISRNF